MMKQKQLSEKGFTLVELLVTLGISSMVTVLITSNLISGIHSFKSVNNQISLHDEANYVMTQFINKIYVATSVNSDNKSQIIVTNYNGDKSTLSFQNGNACINNQVINSIEFSISSASSMQVPNGQEVVVIKLVIQNKETGKSLELDNQVSYVKVE